MHDANTLGHGTHDDSVRFVRQITDVIRDLIAPNPWIYWTDFLLSITLGNLALMWCMESPLWSGTFWLTYFAAGIAFYRATVFSHELTHFRPGTFKKFRFVWNALCGVPFMFPTFLYEDHKAHHTNHKYGTAVDAEYLPLGNGNWLGILQFMSKIFLVPVMGLVRFAILAPLAWVFPSLRNWVWSQSSAAVAMNLLHRRPLPTASELPTWRLQEVACFVYAMTIFTLMAVGVLPWTLLVYYYFTFLLVGLLNYTRTLGAHRYLHDGAPMSYVEQLLDSNTFPGHPVLTELWAPLGMRYHALHHLVPSLPYHNMGIAHRRLMRELPADSPYRQTVRKNLGEALGELARHSWQASHERYQTA